MNKYKGNIMRRMNNSKVACGPWMYITNANSTYVETIYADGVNIGAILRREENVPRYLTECKNVYIPASVSLPISSKLFDDISLRDKRIIEFAADPRYKKLLAAWQTNKFNPQEEICVLRLHNNSRGICYVQVGDIYLHFYQYTKKTVLRVILNKFICIL